MKIDKLKATVTYFWIFFAAITFQPTKAVHSQEIIVQPYLQPGNSSNLLKEQKVIIWQTDDNKGKFKVEWVSDTTFSTTEKIKTARISFVQLNVNNKRTYLYRATLKGLNFDKSYVYRVKLNNRIIGEHRFNSRTKKPQTRFAVFGDSGAGTPEQAAIAYQIYLNKPQFVIVTGDIAYSYGRDFEYQTRFFPFYLAPFATPNNGVPLLGSVPFYMLLGNHDVMSDDLDKYPEGLAFFYYSDLPRNAPIPDLVVKPTGKQGLINAFIKNTAPRYPGTSNYSFDYGNVHIVCLDANYYVNPLDAALIEWLKNDLKNSKADWKVVAYHHPAFTSSNKHYQYQVMRLISPILEELGVDLVFSGHEHNYQRTLPLKFDPKKDGSGSKYAVSEEGSIDGNFKLDLDFDGKEKTRANGIIYIVSGAGGAELYDPDLSENPDLWKKTASENWAPYTKRFVSDRHSFTIIETDGKNLTLKQIDANGNVFDEIKMTK